MKFSIQSLKVGKRLMVLIGLAITTAAILTELGIYNQSKTKASLETIYRDSMVPAGDLYSMTVNQMNINQALGVVQIEVDVVSIAGKSSTKLNEARVADTIKAVDGYIAENEKLWGTFMASDLTTEEKILAEKFSTYYLKYINDGIKPTIQALRTYNQDAVKKSYENGLALDILADDEIQKLVKLQYKIADQEHDSSEALYKSTRTTAIVALGGLIALLIGLGFAVTRSITKTLGGEPGEMYDTANRIAKGDLDFNIALAANDSTSAMAAMATMQGKIKLLVSDAAKLSQAAVEGKLSTRADASQHQGDFRKVVEGVNATLDSVINPLNVAANYVERISKGDIPNQITDNYNGDFNAIKNNLNACIDAVNKMVVDANMLSQAAIEGKLSSRADASKHQGDFRKIVEGVNNTLDAVITPLNVAAAYVDNIAKGSIPAKITDSYNGDFNVLKNNLNTCIDAIALLVKDANMLAQAAQDDKLNERADAGKHQGDYRKVIEGVNGTLDTVMEKNAADAAEKAQEAKVLADAVEETQGVIEGAKAGDLSSRVPLAGKTGAIASLCDGVNALMDKMTEVIVQVREAGETINTAAGEISSGNNDLSQRTEQQASSLEETAASMEQLASTVKNNAENAKQANQLAAAASGVAVKGGQVVGQVVNTMSAINSSAKKIEDIISVIDGIAFQTNILALNAAVEAARAGEQGRGFAVVAGEVRNLAQRSASAAKEIKELITDSVSKTAEGTIQVETAGKTMQEIVSSVQRVTDIMGEITAASVEQSAGIDQVNTAVTTMDEVTQQNAALVEQAAAAAESLVDQAVGLIEVVSAFQLSGSNRAKAPLTRPTVARQPARLTSKPSYSAPPSVKSSTAKIAIKTGTNDADWEEF